MAGRYGESQRLDVITFGESMALMYPEGDGRGLGSGRKLSQSFGGAESNLAIGLARLGCRSGWFGMLGDDPLGHGVVKSLRSEGVDVSRVGMTKEAPTGLMLRESVRGKLSVYYYRSGSAASRMTPGLLDADYIANAGILHITGITAALGSSCLDTVREAVRIARQGGVRISFDPNLRLKLWPIEQARPIIQELAQSADYFLPGYDELRLIYDTEDIGTLLANVRRLPGMTVIKSVRDENWLVRGSRLHRRPFEKIHRLVDPVGAGDGFAAGFLSGIIKGFSPVESLKLGSIVGSLVVQEPGDWEALPLWSEVEAILNKTRHIER
ncbi:sugar kinase [Paenibacillus oenotherae]|uniref:Sugar kinase n=1 Tax=Paenibacillus oenotherae TaxID=1435645 RepID=A0ABS7D8R5_9BACL|nr:sugar kinase [Paenibacillus oenotherae]MBW7476328.1 sugar kinase [Paenibacillus oenotherae]